MQLSEQWLRSWLSLDWDSERLSQALSMAGLEVDARRFVGTYCQDVVVAEVLEIAKHPHADRLQIVSVHCGASAPRQIVCGAKNVRIGMRVPLALPGAQLPAGVIAVTQVRQVLSQGMLCGADELGLADSSEGLMELASSAIPGQSLAEYLQVPDVVLELGITPNRGDCLSIRGLAREVAAITGCALQPVVMKNNFAIDGTVPLVQVRLQSQGCGRYLGRRIVGINPHAETPNWMCQRLERSGMRPVHPIVDCTNYVMLELGQPMHAFDANNIHGDIEVRQATRDETLLGLQGQSIPLNPQHLVIADSEKVLALAGIMGGLDSAVTIETRNIVLEAAWFNPLAVAGKARALGLNTESSHRFERGVDPWVSTEAMDVATALIVEICGGQVGPVTVCQSEENLGQRPWIPLEPGFIERYLGLSLEASLIEAILMRLGMVVETSTMGWRVQPPSWRFDIAEPVDLIEELARIYGYNRLPVRLPKVSMQLGSAPDAQKSLDALLSILLGQGFQEVMTFSFIDPASQSYFHPDVPPLTLANPMSAEMAVMRTCLWVGLLKVAQFNQNRQQGRLRLFETGLCFKPSPSGLIQEPYLAGVMTGLRQPAGWQQSSKDAKMPCDFYDLKGVVELLCPDAEYQVVQRPGLHPGQTAIILRGGQEIGVLGRLHPDMESVFSVQGAVWLFELRVAAIKAQDKPQCQPISRFPTVSRDLAVIVSKKIPVTDLLKAVRAWAGVHLLHVDLFDVYSGAEIPDTCISLAISLTWQALDRTLSDQEIHLWTGAVVQGLADRFSAVLRS